MSARGLMRRGRHTSGALRP